MSWIHRVISFPLPVGTDAFRQHRIERERAEILRVFAADVRSEFRAACEYLGVGVKVHVPAGTTWRLPRVGAVEAGPPVTIMVELLAGQVPADARAPALRGAEGLGVRSVRIDRVAGRWVKVVVGDPDPPADRGDHRHGPRRVRSCARSPRRGLHSPSPSVRCRCSVSPWPARAGRNVGP